MLGKVEDIQIFADLKDKNIFFIYIAVLPVATDNYLSPDFNIKHTFITFVQ
jgi:hypothetical protein